MVRCTDKQIEAIKNVTDELSATIGEGKDDFARDKWVETIDEFLHQNGFERDYN